MRVTPAALVAALVLAAAGVPAAQAADDLTLVSRADGPLGFPAATGATDPSLSADGRLVAFATGVVPGATGPGPTAALLVRDLQTGTTRTVSRADGADGAVASAAGPGRLADSGRGICFLTPDAAVSGIGGTAVVVRDLGTDDDVFAHAARTLSQAVPAADLAADDDPTATGCDVSDDLTRVAFVTDQSLDGGDINGVADVYVADRSVTPVRYLLASRAPGAAGAAGDAASVSPVITPDGRRVAFRSRAANLAAGADDPRQVDVFVRDLEARTTAWASRSSGPDGAPGTVAGAASGPLPGATDPSLSADGQSVAFVSRSALIDLPLSSLVTGTQVRVRSLNDTETSWLATRFPAPTGGWVPADGGADDPELSADGRWVSFSAVPAGAALRAPAAYVYDRFAQRTSLVSRRAGLFGVPADASSPTTAISGDGRSIVFGSFATNLGAGAPADDPTTSASEQAQVYRRGLDPSRPLPADLQGAPVLVLPAALPGLAAPGGRPAAGGLGGPVALRLSEYALIHTTLAVGRRGRSVHGTCVSDTSATRFAPACVSYPDPGVPGATFDGLEGTTTTTSAGLLGTAAPAAGRYRLTVIATDLGEVSTSVGRDVVAGTPAPLDRFGHLDLRRTILSGARRGRRIRIPVTCNHLEVTCRTTVAVRLGTRTITRGTVRLAPGSSRTVELPVGRRDSLRIRGRGRAVRATVVLTTAARGTERIPVRVKRASIFQLLPA